MRGWRWAGIWLIVLSVTSIHPETKIPVVAFFGIRPLEGTAADPAFESAFDAAFGDRLSRSGYGISRVQGGLSALDPGQARFGVGGYYSGSAVKRSVYLQIYDPDRRIVIDAFHWQSVQTQGITLPTEEREDAPALAARISARVVLRITTNPNRRERPENIQEHLTGTPIAGQIQFPLGDGDPGARTAEVFRIMEDQRVITATRSSITVRESPSAVYVITEKMIRERGYRTLSDALQDVPGFDIVHVYGIFPDLLHQRGLVGNNQRTLLYVDGIPDNNISENALLAGSVRFPLHNVERIEVVAGPASALYGANAFNGVINIITKDGSSGRSSASATAGTYETVTRNGGAAGTIAVRGTGSADPEFSYSVGAYVYKTDGPDFGGIQRLEKKNYSRYDAAYAVEQEFCGGTCSPDSSSVGYYWSPFFNQAWEDTYNVTTAFHHGGFRFETIHWQYLQGDGTFANGTQQIDTDKYGLRGSSWDFRNNTAMLGYLHEFTPNLKLDSELITRHTEVLSSSHEQYPNKPGPDAVLRSWDTTTVDGYDRGDYAGELEERLVWKAAGWTEITLGAEGIYSDVPAGYGRSQRIRFTNYASYYQQVIRPASFVAITAGYRYDFNTSYGVSHTPRLSTVFFLSRDLTLKLMYGTGFRAPTPFELYNETKQRRANPDLDPEHMQTIEAGISWRFLQKFYVSAQAYSSHISDLLLEVETNEPNPGQPGTNYNQFRNVGRARISGVEAQGDFGFTTRLDVHASYAYNKGEYYGLPDRLTSSPSTEGRAEDQPALDYLSGVSGRTIVPTKGSIPGIPEHHANVGVTWRFLPGSSIHIRANYVDVRRNIATNPVDSTAPYTLVHINFRQEWGEKFAVSLLIRNAGNVTAYDPGIRTATGAYYPTAHPLEGRNVWLTLQMGL